MKKILTILMVSCLFIITACNPPIEIEEEPVKKLYDVKHFITAGNKSKLLNEELETSTEFDLNVSGLKVTINPEKTFQVMDGFGAAMTESSAIVIANLEPSKRTEVMNQLFGPDGIGISFIRIAMGASDFSLNDFTYNDTLGNVTDLDLVNFTIERDETYLIPILKEALALNPDLLIMASPWSAPAWMKDNKNLNGGRLLSQYHEVYANYFVKFIDAYKAHGIDIYAVTPQNEPLHETNGYPSMYMPASQQIEFVYKLGQAFERESIDTLIFAYDHNWDRMDYPISVLNSKAAKYTAGAALHGYGGNVSETSRLERLFPDKGIWFTEISGGLWATSFPDNITWNMENIFMGMINRSAKGVLMWNIALDQDNGPKNGGCQNCRGVLTSNTETNTVTMNEEYYIIGHFSKFVERDALRIESISNNGNIIVSSFKNPDGSIAVIVHNKNTFNASIFLNIHESSQQYNIPAKGIASFILTEK
ncbi:Glucuronoxylanase xynC precursor [Acholeplasma oculi]|nr:glucosylceramidase [Acholeplasma oculi]SUT89980.1 Glucuronoxylanase xynC precursor [Acholeplasma oculi]